MDLRDIAALRQAKREGTPAPEGGVVHVHLGAPKAYADNPHKFRFCFSDGSVDRAGDSIAPDGWDWANFNKNPVALWAHDSFSPPIGRAGNLAVENGRLMGDIEFMAADVYPFADSIRRMVEGGYIQAVSVGFIPRKYAFVESAERPWGIDFQEQELVEISLVPVPCNANALIDARAKGINAAPMLEWARRVAAIDRAAGMNEADPAAGGALVAPMGSCGRAADEECGMKDPQECAIHRSDDTMDETKLASVISAAVAQGVAKGIAEGMKVAGKPKARQRMEGGEDPEDDTPPEQKAIRRAHKALRAVRDLSGDVSDAVDALEEIAADLADAAEDEGAGHSSAAEDEEEKAARRRRAASLKHRLSM